MTCCKDRPDPVGAINNVYDLPSIEPAIRYLHGAIGYPTKATWLKAIHNGNYLTWPLFKVKILNKFFPESEETHKGHMRTQRQGVQSTKATAQQAAPLSAAQTGDSPPNNTTDSEEPEAAPIPKRKDIFISLYKTRDTIYTDQTGKFPHTSSRGKNYQMVIHNIDGNSTWVETMKTKTQGEMINSRRRALIRMKLQGIIPLHQILQNEISQAYKDKIHDTGMTYHLVPPDNRRRNIAKRYIQMWKNHFVRVISGAAATSPLHLWCQAIPQAERQFLLLG